jgi:hypothetical protein
MRGCPDLCDEVIDRLRQLGFAFDDSEDHEQIFTALSRVRFGFVDLVNWTVTILVTRRARSSEPDEDVRAEYKEEVEACSETDAIERAKDRFHAMKAIACVDDFQIAYTATRTVRCSRNHRHHLLIPPSDACPKCGEYDLCNLARDDADDVHCHACGHAYHRSNWY